MNIQKALHCKPRKVRSSEFCSESAEHGNLIMNTKFVKNSNCDCGLDFYPVYVPVLTCPDAYQDVYQGD